MDTLTRNDVAVGVAERWRQQYREYFQNPALAQRLAFRPIEVYAKLLGLGENPNPDDVDAAIGNRSWTALNCGECLGSFDKVVVIGNEHYLCKDCLKRALKLMK